MTFIVENWTTIAGVTFITVSAIVAGVKFVKKGKAAQLRNLKEWLLYAVTEAERELGGGTGRLKLRCVYNLFVSKFPILAQFMTFDRFSDLVDEALDEMNDMLDNNGAVQNYVYGVLDTAIRRDEEDEHA